MELYLGSMLAKLLDWSCKVYRLLGQLYAAFGNLGEQIGRCDGSEQLSALAGLYGERNRHIGQHLGKRLRVFKLFGFAQLARFYEGFNLLFIGFVYGNRNLLGEKEIAGVPRFYGDLFAFSTQVFDGL